MIEHILLILIGLLLERRYDITVDMERYLYGRWKSKKIKDLKEPEELNEIKISARKTKYALLQQIHVFSQLCSLSIKDVSDLSSAYKQLHGCMIEELKLTLASNKVELDDDEQSDEDYDNMPSADLIALVSNIKKDLK